MINYKIPTKDEMKVLCNAVKDFDKQGFRDIKCPRCGKDLDFYRSGNAYAIKCSSNSCLMANMKEL